MSGVGGGRGPYVGSTVASFSTSASMISPLNPLPSPWASSDEHSSAFSPPQSQLSEISSATTTSSGGAIRLNRVPTSVRMAAELIKNTGGNGAGGSPSSGGSASSTASVLTPNPSPASSVPVLSNMPPRALRDLVPIMSMPPPSTQAPGSSPVELGKGRPSLSVPVSPMTGRNVIPTDTDSFATPSPSGVPERPRLPSAATLAPPSTFKEPSRTDQGRPRPSPFEAPSLAESSSSAAKHHRYRVSMHEAIFQPSFSSDVTEGSDHHRSEPHGRSPKTPTLLAHLHATSVSGSVTPGAPANQPRVRSTTGKALQMDLAGIPSLGDAASHASMIMQSRQAKLQRWRPSSIGNPVGSSYRAYCGT